MKELVYCIKCYKNTEKFYIENAGNHLICEDCYKNLNDILFKVHMDFIQPERSKREDSQKCEMRCSEHCGNTVRDK